MGAVSNRPERPQAGPRSRSALWRYLPTIWPRISSPSSGGSPRGAGGVRERPGMSRPPRLSPRPSPRARRLSPVSCHREIWWSCGRLSRRSWPGTSSGCAGDRAGRRTRILEIEQSQQLAFAACAVRQVLRSVSLRDPARSWSVRGSDCLFRACNAMSRRPASAGSGMVGAARHPCTAGAQHLVSFASIFGCGPRPRCGGRGPADPRNAQVLMPGA